jgi:hypothetical protein
MAARALPGRRVAAGAARIGAQRRLTAGARRGRGRRFTSSCRSRVEGGAREDVAALQLHPDRGHLAGPQARRRTQPRRGAARCVRHGDVRRAVTAQGSSGSLGQWTSGRNRATLRDMSPRSSLALVLVTACQRSPTGQTGFGSTPEITTGPVASTGGSSTSSSSSGTTTGEDSGSGGSAADSEPPRDLGVIPDFGPGGPVGCKGKIDFPVRDLA